MRYRQLDLNLLVALDALLEEKSITRAALKLNISQPGMSGALNRLREYFNDDLLVRIGRRMELTPLGERLVEPVRDILMKIRSTLESAPEFDPTTAQQEFIIVMSDYMEAVLLPEVIRRVSIEAPNVTIMARPLTSELAEVLDQGDVDFVIVPEQFVLDNHASMKLLDETWTCVVWENNHRVAGSLELGQYLEMDHVVMSYGDGRSPILEDWFLSKLGLSRSVKAIVSDWSLVARAIVGTKYIATLQTRLCKEAARNLPVRLLAPPLKIPPLVEVLQWHRYRDHDSSSMWMRQMLTDVAAKI